MRVAITGCEGQVARAMLERGPIHGSSVVAVGRPELDLARPETIMPALSRASPDIIVSAAAYTAVDQAETEPDLAETINGRGAASVAEAAVALRVPIVHLSTDYVFDGSLGRPYVETDPVSPVSAYGRSKLAGERAVAAANPNHAVLRTAWVYSPFGRNFVKTMLRLAAMRDEISVVADQCGSPTNALDIADGVLQVARNLLERPAARDLRGVFHMTGAGHATWAEFACAVFAAAARHGGPSARVNPITTDEYPTAARRPANSRLDCTKIAARHRVILPDWRLSVEGCIRRLVEEARSQGTPG